MPSNRENGPLVGSLREPPASLLNRTIAVTGRRSGLGPDRGPKKEGPMDLLACSECECRFYVPGLTASDDRHCPQCGADLALAVHGLASIPLDARWLSPRTAPDPEITVVELPG